MTHIAKPRFQHPLLGTNELGLSRRDYEGTMSTLCAGCGHDSISAAIIQACAEMSMPPHMMAKLSGIGCSSKTPNYFLSKSHGFNSVHGRMPSIATGSNLANHELYYVGVSGDGDTASIGLGQFAHAVRRQVNMLYIVENNGTYGLTKGQLSATADMGMRSKTGEINPHDSIDLVSLALQLGASFVARGFSGDKDQLVPLIKAGFAHRGFALLDIISPCVTFNNHADSTKSFDYVREHNAIMNRPDFVPHQKEITVSYEAGESRDVALHDGGTVRLHKLAEDYDPTDRVAALHYVQELQTQGEIPTGLIFLDAEAPDLHERMGTPEVPSTGSAKRSSARGARNSKRSTPAFADPGADLTDRTLAPGPGAERNCRPGRAGARTALRGTGAGRVSRHPARPSAPPLRATRQNHSVCRCGAGSGSVLSMDLDQAFPATHVSDRARKDVGALRP